MSATIRGLRDICLMPIHYFLRRRRNRRAIELLAVTQQERVVAALERIASSLERGEDRAAREALFTGLGSLG